MKLLDVVLLSQIENNPSTGYDLSKLVVDRGWEASHQQIYRNLNRLADQGLLLCSYVPQSGKPDKKIYEITQAGLNKIHEEREVEPIISKVQDQATTQLLIGNTSYFLRLAEVLNQHILALRAKYRDADELTAWCLTARSIAL